MKKNIKRLLEKELNIRSNNLIDKGNIEKLLHKLENDTLSREEAYEIVDYISNQIELDNKGNPINDTILVEECIDWLIKNNN